MKCQGCGYVSFDHVETCGNCGARMAPAAQLRLSLAPPGVAPDRVPDPDLGADLRALRLEPDPLPTPRTRKRPGGTRRRARTAGEEGAEPLAAAASPERPAGGTARVSEGDRGLPAPRPAHRAAGRGTGGEFHLGGESPLSADAKPWPGPVLAQPPLPFLSPDWKPGGAPAVEPIIDRHDEVPECFWAPAGAGLSRRSAAILIDQALQAALLGLFFLGALLMLAREGLAADTVLAPAGLQAALLPFALLATLLSLAYYVLLPVVLGGTPGRRLAGVEVRTLDGAAPSPARAAARWGAAVLGLACAGVGIVWALFESRRRGWADLLSGTVIVELRREEAAGPTALTTPGGAGTMPPL